MVYLLRVDCASRTRGVFLVEHYPMSDILIPIDFVTIASTGNATDFGDVTNSRWLRS